MQKTCVAIDGNWYFSCRKEAAKKNNILNSRAGAADLLNVSESSLRDYEVRNTPVPLDVVARMAALYNAPELENYYCCNECPIGCHSRPELSYNIKALDRIVCSFLYHSDGDKLERIRKTVLRIASDGELSRDEQNEMQDAVKYLQHLSCDISDMNLLLQKRGVK